MPRKVPYLYTETAFHHEGDIDFMMGLIDASKQSGANGIKFQVLMKLDNLLSVNHSGFSSLEHTIFTFEKWVKILKYCKEVGLDVIFMPIDLNAFALLDVPGVEVKYIDIHSVCFTDQKLLDRIKATSLPVILGVGGRTLTEITEKAIFFGEQLEVLMVGFQAFPSAIEDVKLKRIAQYQNHYPSLRIGYADHSAHDSEWALKSNEMAFLLGATYFEKHITTREGENRIDFQSAIGPEKMSEVRAQLDFLAEDVLGIEEGRLFAIEGKEIAYRNRQKMLVAAKPLAVGEKIDPLSFTSLMIDQDGGTSDRAEILGKKVINPIKAFDVIRLEDLA